MPTLTWGFFVSQNDSVKANFPAVSSGRRGCLTGGSGDGSLPSETLELLQSVRDEIARECPVVGHEFDESILFVSLHVDEGVRFGRDDEATEDAAEFLLEDAIPSPLVRLWEEVDIPCGRYLELEPSPQKQPASPVDTVAAPHCNRRTGARALLLEVCSEVDGPVDNLQEVFTGQD